MEEAMSQKQHPRGKGKLAQPSFSHFDQASSSTRPSTQAANTGFREWLKKITYGDNGSVKLACEHIRLEQIRKIVKSILSAHLVGMSSRDLRLYLRVISASRLTTVRELRFECFDLMCRKISEPVAVRKLREMDALLG